MNHQAAYKDFTARFKLLISKNPHLITTTLSNIFTMRLIGNKTGDLAEIAIAEFINQYMYDFKAELIGKDVGLKIINVITKEAFLVRSKLQKHLLPRLMAFERVTLTRPGDFSSFNT